MILPLILIIILSLFVFYCVYYMLKNGDDISAMGFAFLYVYTIFAQIGYAYFCEISIFIGAYFGSDIFYDYWLFMFLSFVFTFIVYQKTKIEWMTFSYKVVKKDTNVFYIIFLSVSVILYFLLELYFIKNRQLFMWGAENPMGSNFFVIFFRYFTVILIILYALIRTNNSFFKSIIFFVYLLFFLEVSSAAGSRSNVLYLFIAVLFFELSPFVNSIRFYKKKIIYMLFMFVLVIYSLFIILDLRTKTNDISLGDIVNYSASNELTDEESEPLYNKILFQDYYSPSHILFISMHYDVIDFIEVLKSNIANSLTGIRYPHLSQTIAYAVDKNTTRGTGWSYHFFVEGYNAFGWIGIFYNAIMWNLMISFWTMLLKTDDVFFRRVFTALIAYFVINAMRSQSCFFIQVMWMFYLPAFFLLAMAINSKITIFIKRY